MPTLVQPPFPLFTDVDGDPLENGYIYIGEPGLNPQANPIQAYWDASMVITAAQPIRTKGGYPVRSGSPARIYVPSNYSILVKNKNGTLVYSNLDSTDYFNSPSGGVVLKANTIADLRMLIPTTDEGYPVQVEGYYAPGDGGGGPIRYWDHTSVESDDNGSIIKPTALGIGDPGRWKLVDTSGASVRWFGAKADAATNDVAAIQACINYCMPLGLAVNIPYGSYRCASGITMPSGKYDVRSEGDLIFDAGVTAAISIGAVGADTYGGSIVGLSLKKLAYSGGDSGIVLLNVTESLFDSCRCVNFENGILAIPSAASRIAYNSFVNQVSIGHAYGFKAVPAAGCYVNENSFMGGRFHSDAALRLVSHVYLDNSTGSDVQHNKFISCSIEGYSGGGACGVAAVQCLNASRENVFIACRTEKAGTGWSSGYAYNFDATSLRNHVQNNEISGNEINDVSGTSNIWMTTGLKINDATGNAAHKSVEITRRSVNNNETHRYAIEATDIYAASGKVGFLKYTSPLGESRAGKLVSLNTTYGEVFVIDDAGSLIPKDNFCWLGDSSHRFSAIWAVLPVYANDATAKAGGLLNGAFYRTATGEVRITLP